MTIQQVNLSTRISFKGVKSRFKAGFKETDRVHQGIELLFGFIVPSIMRRTTDHGVVLVLDSRILRKRYGSAFIESLPETKQCFSSRDDILREVENVLFS